MKTMIYVSSGRNYANILFKLHNQMQGVKNLIIFLVVGNDKTIHAPTSTDCYFCQLNFFKNFDYRYYLFTTPASNNSISISDRKFLFNLIKFLQNLIDLLYFKKKTISRQRNP